MLMILILLGESVILGLCWHCYGYLLIISLMVICVLIG